MEIRIKTVKLMVTTRSFIVFKLKPRLSPRDRSNWF